eukprot:TRINITY_DN7829_c0_g1_i1.p1 TRINITY_DN7829_c0_g1~~TRINITY_DN7829_c0_g1_i1.p1  ORF type:complete len:169 (-),score=12.18 TRINITY_DN7829_c0_g1_i1:32-538(-)
MPRIYAPVSARSRRSVSLNSTPRSIMERGVRDQNPVQEMVSAANMLYSAGTHRSHQCKENLRTPGPGAYRHISNFPTNKADEAHSHCIKRRSPQYQMQNKGRSRIADIAIPYSIVPPVVNIFRAQAGEVSQKTSGSRPTVNTLPPCNADHRILKGHGGDFPKGHGLPF